MTLTRWDPFRDLLSLAHRAGSPVLGSDDAYGAWAPAVDIVEKGDSLIIRAEIPGVDKSDIDVRVEDNSLVLRGERKREEELDEGNAYRLERAFGAFVRSFRLPKHVDASRIAAKYSDGVLEVELPKADEAKPRKVEIQAA
ncbi:MAG: Hsp20/alpha crystallin family protein [bacterium]|nr:Hsp20/alpha crystallin family protein [bacterium]